MSLVMGLIFQLLGLVDLLLLVYCVLTWLPIPSNQLVVVLRRYMDPVLEPIRRVLNRVLPQQLRMFDFSPLAAWVLLSIIRKILGLLL